MVNWHIGPPIPWRDANLLTDLINAIYSTTLVTTGYDQIAVNQINQV